MSAAEIIKQIKSLPKEELAQVIDYLHQLDRQMSRSHAEMTDEELLAAAKRSGTFETLDSPEEDIYSAEGG